LERRRLPLTIVFGVLISCLLLCARSQWEGHRIVEEFFFLFGICLAAVGTLGRTWSNLFISGYKTKSLIQTGPYSMCRNPLYFFSAIGMVGIGLCSGTLFVPAIMVFFFAIYYPMIIRSEESRLASWHDHSFGEYCSKTPAFWPRTAIYQEPETYLMYPPVMRKNMADAFWFIALAALVHLVSVLHAANVLPTLIEIW
jgi:protein-S-isoprenylcysteine O-methyltransferase Ste14